MRKYYNLIINKYLAICDPYYSYSHLQQPLLGLFSTQKYIFDCFKYSVVILCPDFLRKFQSFSQTQY